MIRGPAGPGPELNDHEMFRKHTGRLLNELRMLNVPLAPPGVIIGYPL